MTRLFWPLPPSAVLTPTFLITLVVLISTWPQILWPYPQWVDTSVQFHQQFVVVGPISAAAAAFVANRLMTSHRIHVQTTAVRLPALGLLRQYVIAAAFFVGAYLLGLAPLVVNTAILDDVGEPQSLPMAVGLLAIFTATAVGFLIGSISRSLVTVPVAALLLFAVTPLHTANLGGYAAFSPFQEPVATLVHHEAPEFAALRGGIFLAVAAIAVTAAMLLVARRTRRLTRQSALWGTATLTGATVIIGLLGSPAQATFEPQAVPTPTCQSDEMDIEYCVHPGYRRQLPLIVARASEVLNRYGTKPVQFTRAWDEVLIATRMAHGQSFPTNFVPMGRDPRGEVHIEHELVRILAFGIDDCGAVPTKNPVYSGEYPLPTSMAMFLEGGQGQGVFEGLPTKQIQAWIAAHQNKIATCTVTPADLPQR